MLTSSFRRKTAFLVLVANLATPLVLAAAPRTKDPQPLKVAASILTNVMNQAWGFLTGIWVKLGCNVDPNGLCKEQPAAQTESSCNIDPNGQCTTQPAARTKDGCNVDPNGGCRP